ncbi:MAG: hypothetical protein JSW03_01635 [Candidatus Eiseniibacteriota bacterium]|nr:MAG: hypothetical protein JSW03_01635 [Candidatus Eisenbacteria bacterium]
MKLKFVSALIVFSCLCVSVHTACQAGTSPQPSRARPPVEPSYRVMLRSLVYPGWGQLYNGSSTKAVVVFASETALLGMIYHESREATKAYDAHLAAPDPNAAARLYEEYERHFERRESFIWWTVGLVLFSMADAYVDANLTTFEEEFDDTKEGPRVSLRATGSPRGGFVSLQYLF